MCVPLWIEEETQKLQHINGVSILEGQVSAFSYTIILSEYEVIAYY